MLTGGSVVSEGALVIVTPAASGTQTTTVSYQMHNGSNMLDVNLDGVAHYFSPSAITSLDYLGNSASGSQTFEDSTTLSIYAFGGSGTNLFEGGSGTDAFFGGSGSNTFDAGTGFDQLVGGFGTNVFNENAAGSGIIEEAGFSNTVNVPPGETGAYFIIF